MLREWGSVVEWFCQSGITGMVRVVHIDFIFDRSNGIED